MSNPITNLNAISSNPQSLSPARTNSPADEEEGQTSLETRKKPAETEINGKSLALYEQTFLAMNNSLHRTEIQAGFLPFNNQAGRLLLSGIVAEQQSSAPDNFWNIDHQHMSYGFEPQLQLHLGESWEMYLRTPLTYHEPYADTPSSTDFLTDLTISQKGFDKLIRLEYGANNVGTNRETSQYATLTPYHRFHIYKDRLILRLGTKYAHYFAENSTDALTLETKLEGTINHNPWSGWGVQFFVPIALNADLQEGQRRVDFAGIYLWAGSVLPPSWLGPGFFAEGGVWVGGHINESEHPEQDLVAGINLKIKYGTEARWWQ